MRKNAHAAALGRIRTAKKAASSARNGRRGGRPVVYRLAADGSLEHRQQGRWLMLIPPYTRAAREAFRRLSR